MQKRNVKMLVLTAALATATVAVARLQQQNFSDIPAGHWAREAVQAIAAEGLITGYQDGTFQGQRTLTRYEAATIFYRLLQSGRLQQMTPAQQGTVQQGMGEVSTELAALRTQVTDTTTRLAALEEQVKTLSAAPASGTTPAAASPELDARIKAIEDEIAALKSAAPAATTPTTPAAPAALSPEVEARIKALEDEIAALKSAAPAAPATGAVSPELEARIKALEDKVAAAPAAPTTTTPPAPATATVPPELEARIKALEDRAAAAPAGGGDTTALQGTVQAQETRIAALESSVASLQTAVNELRTNATATPPAPTQPVTTTPVVEEPTGPVTSISIGLGGAANLIGPVGAGASPFGLYGQLAVNNIAGPVGIRAFADLSSIPVAGGQILLNLGGGGFDPYLGVGAGVQFAGGATNFLIAGSVGANIGFGGGFGAFAEVNPRYLLSTGQFSVKAAFGLRLAF
jgi:uncharacterized protein YceH (UPF0502 family)